MQLGDVELLQCHIQSKAGHVHCEVIGMDVQLTSLKDRLADCEFAELAKHEVWLAVECHLDCLSCHVDSPDFQVECTLLQD